MGEEEKISYFTDGPHDITGRYVRFQRPNSLEQAIKIAENYERFRKNQNRGEIANIFLRQIEKVSKS